MSIYKDCDIRGIYGTELNEADVYMIGRALGTVLDGRSTVIGGDVRMSTPALMEECIKGLLESGAVVYDLGTVTTPMMYFAKKHLGSFGGIMITASHNPAVYNGIKIMFGDEPVAPEFIREVKALVSSGAFRCGEGRLEKKDIREDYFASFAGKYHPEGVKLVLDCCDGAASLSAPTVARRLGCEVTELFCGLDGSFPNRDPNPAVYANLGAVRECVRAVSADMGAAFDGDGDRVVFCDETGAVIPGEQALVLMAKRLMKKGDTLVYDQKSCSIVADEVRAIGGEPIMERSGHAFIKKTFLENSSALAGEISGHFFFGDIGYDDGLYAALLLADILKRSGKKLSELTADLPEKLITPDIRVPVPYAKQQELLDRLKAGASGFRVTRLDGLRLEADSGWILVRKSVTEEVMTVRMEAKDTDSMKELSEALCGILPEMSLPVSEVTRFCGGSHDAVPAASG